MSEYNDKIQEIYRELGKRCTEHHKEWRRYGGEQNLGKSDAMDEACRVIEKITGIKQEEVKL